MPEQPARVSHSLTCEQPGRVKVPEVEASWEIQVGNGWVVVPVVVGMEVVQALIFFSCSRVVVDYGMGWENFVQHELITNNEPLPWSVPFCISRVVFSMLHLSFWCNVFLLQLHAKHKGLTVLGNLFLVYNFFWEPCRLQRKWYTRI